MKTCAFYISIVLLFPISAKADYAPMKLVQMALEADTIVYARIEKVGKYYFWASTLNATVVKPLKVLKFRDWPCAKRWATYEVGQKVILFLQKENDYYRIMSAGGEGELAISGDSVMINARCLPFKNSLIRADSIHLFRITFGRSICTHKSFYNASDLWAAVVRFRAIYKWRQSIPAATADGTIQGEELFAILKQEYERS